MLDARNYFCIIYITIKLQRFKLLKVVPIIKGYVSTFCCVIMFNMQHGCYAKTLQNIYFTLAKFMGV
jgi:hypothetical protein